jgi:hypothetical protein
LLLVQTPGHPGDLIGRVFSPHKTITHASWAFRDEMAVVSVSLLKTPVQHCHTSVAGAVIQNRRGCA